MVDFSKAPRSSNPFDTARDILSERGGSRFVGLTKLVLAVGEEVTGLFCGLVDMPAAASKPDLGRFLVAVYVTENNGPQYMVLTTTTRHLKFVRPLTLHDISRHPDRPSKEGNTKDIRVRTTNDPHEDVAASIFAQFGVPWNGSAASFFNDDGTKNDIRDYDPKTWNTGGKRSVAPPDDAVGILEQAIEERAKEEAGMMAEIPVGAAKASPSSSDTAKATKRR